MEHKVQGEYIFQACRFNVHEPYEDLMIVIKWQNLEDITGPTKVLCSKDET